MRLNMLCSFCGVGKQSFQMFPAVIKHGKGLAHGTEATYYIYYWDLPNLIRAAVTFGYREGDVKCQWKVLRP